jgi:hypothetical protein
MPKRKSQKKPRPRTRFKVVTEKARGSTVKGAVPKTSRAPRNAAPSVNEKSPGADLENIEAPNVDSLRTVAQRSIDQTRESFERSANAANAALERWADSLDEIGQEIVAINRKFFEAATRNIETNFDLATSLSRARNAAEVMEAQAAYWRKRFGEVRMQAEELRATLQTTTVRALERSSRMNPGIKK